MPIRKNVSIFSSLLNYTKVGLHILLRALGAILITKIVALYYGPSGLAIFAHFQNISSLALILPSEVLGRFLVLLKIGQRSAAFRHNSHTLTFFAGLVFFLVGLPLVVWLCVSSGILPKMGFGWAAALIWGFALLGMAAFGPITQYLALRGLQSLLTKISAAMILISVLASWLIAIQNLDLAWMGIASLLSILPVLGLIFYLYQKQGHGFLDPKIRFYRAYLPFLKQALWLALAIGASGLLTQYLARLLAIQHLGLETTGFWQAINRLSDAYSIPANTLGALVFLPKLQALIGKKQTLNYLGQTAGWGAGPVAALLILVWLLREPIFLLLTGPAFLPATDWLHWQLYGDFFRIASVFLAYWILSNGNTKVFIFFQIGSSILYLVLVWVFLPLGLTGFLLAYSLRYLAYAGGLLAYNLIKHKY